MKRLLSILTILCLSAALGYAQVPYGEVAPDVKYPVSGQRKLSRLSNDDVLFTILAFENEAERGSALPVWYTDQSIQPYFQNYNPDYGRTLMIVTTNLSEYAQTDWAAYILKAKDLFDSGQIFAAQRIVSDCLNHARWVDSFPPEVHKAIPQIVASMEHGDTFDERYMFYVAEIKHRYNLGILSEEDVAPFKNQFSMIHMMGDKD